MLGDKKSIYHSYLAKAGPVQVTITSDVLTSKYKKEGEAGHYYVNLSHEGSEQSYPIENHQGKEALSGLRGQTVTLIATGYREDAHIEVQDSQGSTQAPKASPPRSSSQGVSTPQPPKQDALEAFQDELARVNNALHLIKIAVSNQRDQYPVSNKGEEMSMEHFQAECATAFIHLDRSGLIAQLPTAPVWTGHASPEDF